MNNFLLVIGGLVVLILGALFAVPMIVDWNSYRGVFEEEASRLIGREVRVNGAVNLRLLPTPTVRFEGVRVADAAGRTGEPFFRADDFTLHLAVGPLLQGVIEATDIELKRPVLRIAFDDQGGASWRGLKSGDLRSGFTPKDLALPSVRISDGTIVVHGRSGDEKLRLEKVNGEIGAPGLEGPYKARLTFAAGGGEQEIRIATARVESDGVVRLKATVRSLASGLNWAFDGRLSGMQDKPAIKGELTGKLPLAPADRKTGKAGEDQFDLKATLAADAAGFEIGELALGIEKDGRPQLLTGDVRGVWRDAAAVDVTLSSHWLDLDGIAASAEKSPIGIVGRLAEGLERLPRTVKISVKTVIEQASIAGDVASNVVLALDRADSSIIIRELRAAVPGGTRLEARGMVSGAGTPEQRFDGELLVRGASLSRALGWAFRGLPMPEISRDGSFGIAAKLSIAPKEIAANDVTAELNGNALSGSLNYSWAGRTRLAIAVEGAEVDAGVLAIGDLGLGPMVTAITTGAPVRVADRSKKLPDIIRLRLNAGRLLAGETSFRDVAADVVVEAGGLAIETLRVATEDGVALEASGRLAGLDQRPKGTLGWQLSAADATALAATATLLRLPIEWRPEAGRAAALAPLRLAGTLAVGQRTADARDLVFDGMSSASRVSGSLRLDVNPKSIVEFLADLSIEMTSPEVAKLLRQLAPAQAAAATERFGQGKGRLQIKGVGRLASGIVALALLEAPGLAAEYSGRIGISRAQLNLEGDVRIDGEMPRVLAVAGLGARPGYDGVGVSGSARLRVKDGAIRVDGSALKIAGTDVSARALWPAAAGDKLQLEVRASDVSLMALLGLALDGRARARDPALPQGTAGLWPDSGFELSALERWPAIVRIETARLSIAPDLIIHDAALSLQITGGKVDVTLAGGKAAGGTVAGKLALGKAPAGAALSGDVRVTGLDLALLAQAGTGKSSASGKANLDMKLAASALSLRGLIAALEGKGQIELGATRIARFSPAAVAAAVDTLILAKEPVAAAELRRLLLEKLAAGELVIGARRLPIEIVEGQVRISPFTVDTAEGRVVSRSQLDLESLRLDSEWRLEPKAADKAGGQRPALPPVTVHYSGPFSQLGRLEADLKTDALEREISVRRMEREVEELERLRREDEARALQEAEKQKALGVQPSPGAAPGAQLDAQPQPPTAGAIVVPPKQPGPAQPPATAPPPAAVPPPEPPIKAAPEPKAAPVPPPPRPAKRPQYVNPFKTDSGG